MGKNHIFKGLKKYILLLLLLSGILSYLSLQLVAYISYAIDGIIFRSQETLPNYLKPILELDMIKGLLIFSLILVFMNSVILLIRYIRERITTKFTLKINSNLKGNLFAHILKLKYESYYSYSKVEMLQRVNEDAQEYSNFFQVQFNLILDIVSLSFFLLSQKVFFNRSITLYLVFTIVIMLAFSFWYYRKMTQILEKVILKKRKMLGATVNNINQFKFVRIYNRQKEEIQKYKRLNKDYTR